MTFKYSKHTRGMWVARSRSMSDGSLVMFDREYNEVLCIRPQEQREYGEQDERDLANAVLIEQATRVVDATKMMPIELMTSRESVINALNDARSLIKALRAVAWGTVNIDNDPRWINVLKELERVEESGDE